MTVKDLAALYDSRGPDTPIYSDTDQTSPSAARRAKFLAHPLLRHNASQPQSYTHVDSLGDHSQQEALNTNDNLTTDTPDPIPQYTSSANGTVAETETLEKGTCRTHDFGRSSWTIESETVVDGDHHEMKVLSSRGTTITEALPIISPSSTITNNPTVLHHHLGPHSPIAASVVFSRNASPLSFPDLDKNIASLPAPSFPSSVLSAGQDTSIFPPMELLAASGKSLEDLENNSQIPHWWQSRNTLFGAMVSIALSITGSSALTSLYSLHGLIDTVQIFALILNTIVPHSGKDVKDEWHNLIFGTIPNILAFNLATSVQLALIMLLVFMTVSGVLLYFFFRATSLCCRLSTPEGLQKASYMKNQWSLVIISFFLSVIYLPLSTMAMHVLVWSEDLWIVPNPYTNATSFPPNLPPLGPSSEFRDPLDFCWTTTMERNELNYAPVIVIIAIICVSGLTLWFPIHLRRAILTVCPRVDLYTELGTRRSNSDMDREYQRLLERDHNPLQFLYHDYRRGWAAYQANYLFAKLAALAIVAIIDADNCLFRTLPRVHVQVARQITLLVAMVGFFLVQCFLAPFLDPVSNASEWTSRMNYVLTSAIALGVALNLPGQTALNGVVLYIVYIVTYGLGVYFTVINWSITQRLVKKLARRIDFSIDIFSPRLDLSPTSAHIRRRIWQEAISVLILTNPECGIPKIQPMQFAQARDSEYPPYLLAFAGSPGERHVENLKILREAGSLAYKKGIALLSGPGSHQFRRLEEIIQHNFLGPDCYWKSPTEPTVPGCKRFFGNAWYIPFPPTVVIRYDEGPMAILNEMSDLELYVRQNSSHDIRRRREVRLALRALDGQVVAWPYEYVQPIGSRRPLLCCCPGRRYHAQTSIHYRACIFRLKQHDLLTWEGLRLGSGFEVELTYAKSVVVDGSVIGLNDDFDLTPSLARFLTLNEELIPNRLARFEVILDSYQNFYRLECRAKAETLSYQFLAFVYNTPCGPAEVAEYCAKAEQDERVQRLVLASERIFRVSYERLLVASATELNTWWYLFWDDVWRRNHETVSGLQKYASDFDPHYPTSVAYKPLPRAALESFLSQRGLLHKKPKWGDFFHAGILNKVYLRMNDISFHGTRRADIIHLGGGSLEFDMEEIDDRTLGQPSSLGTGGGTDHDDESIRARPIYRWEGILDDPLRKTKKRRHNFLAKLGVWFGVTPLWRAGTPSMGLALDVRLDNGRYMLLQDEPDEPKSM